MPSRPDGQDGLSIVRAIVDGERTPAELAKLRDKRCKKSPAQIAEHLTGTWRDDHLFNLKMGLRRYDDITRLSASTTPSSAGGSPSSKRQSDANRPPRPSNAARRRPSERVGTAPSATSCGACRRGPDAHRWHQCLRSRDRAHRGRARPDQVRG